MALLPALSPTDDHSRQVQATLRPPGWATNKLAVSVADGGAAMLCQDVTPMEVEAAAPVPINCGAIFYPYLAQIDAIAAHSIDDTCLQDTGELED
jgi:hypothetical protein